ncbi:unnamed protein product [Sphagnum jensenii]
MTPSTCATAVRFLPQIDFQQVAPLQAVPPIDTASGITPGENFQDGIYMKQRNHISISPWKFRCSVQAAYVKHAISIKFNMHIRVQIARKPSEKIKALEQACGSSSSSYFLSSSSSSSSGGSAGNGCGNGVFIGLN